MPGTLQDYAQAVHDVISINRDAEQGYRGAAHAVNDPAMKEMFAEYAAQHARFATELQDAVKALGFEPIDPQGVGGMLHASWMSLKGIFTGHNVHAILVEAERGEDLAVRTYQIALSKTLTPEIAQVMQKQFAEMQAAHDRIRTLRDANAPPPEETPKPPATSPSVSSTNDVPKGI
jgi:uncharacterized protein (TIGR02284 family)